MELCNKKTKMYYLISDKPLETKNLKFVTAIAAVAVAGSVVVCSCKKDPAEITNGVNSKGSGAAPPTYAWYEQYAPDEGLIEENLLIINDCVNDPGENPLPDMELNEAVWFLEAYFNIGVCQKQEYPVEYVSSKETYSIQVPVSSQWSGNFQEIILDGIVLQNKYNALLTDIVNEVCSEFAINFGDVYVVQIGTNPSGGGGYVVTLGLEILYGPKQQKGGQISDPSNWSYLVSGRKPLFFKKASKNLSRGHPFFGVNFSKFVVCLANCDKYCRIVP